VRRIVMLVSAIGLLLTACGSSGGKASVQVTPTTTVAADTTTSTLPFTTTSLPCQSIPMPNTPVSNPSPSKAVLLTAVRERGDGCVDHVVFDFKGKYPEAPGYSISYGTPPFVQDGSGAPVVVAGNAFIVVRLAPAYGYDFETGVQTYNGAHRIAATDANHVTEVVETGDFEAVVTWIIGLDTKRPFTVEATGAPAHQLVVTIS
jgi:hypothetical protein